MTTTLMHWMVASLMHIILKCRILFIIMDILLIKYIIHLQNQNLYMQDDDPEDFTDEGYNIVTDEIGLVNGSSYKLSFSSPCIDAGNSYTNGILSTDIEGNNRIVGSRIDIGAFEYQGN